MRNLFFIFLALLTSCAVQKKQSYVEELNSYWIPEVLMGEELLIDSLNLYLPFIKIDAKAMEFAGHDNCNSFGGTLMKCDENNFMVKGTSSSLILCDNMDIPTNFGRALDRVVSYRIKKTKLYFFDEEGKELAVFYKRKDNRR